MKKPKISIITVCYNSEAHIEETIQSVINQSYDNKEYIVIDGGSNDDTLAIIKKYRSKIDYFVSEPDNGISDAFNKGIKAATGDVIGICNADDMLSLNCMQILADNFETGIDIYRMNETIKNFETNEEFLIKPTLVYKRVFYSHESCHMGCFITKNAYKKYGMYDINLQVQMDTDLLRRFTMNGAKYKYIDANCGFFRRGGVSSTAIKRRNYERSLILRKYGANNTEVLMVSAYHRLLQFIKVVLIFFHIDPTKLKTKIKRTLCRA